MLERFLLNAEENLNIFKIFFSCFLITVVLAYINSFIGGNSLFLVALISLALVYPVVNYIRSMTKKELQTRMNSLNLIKRHDCELIVFWTIFIAITVGLYVSFPLITDYTYQGAFVEKITGNFFNNTAFFKEIFFNNMIVALFTFVISLITFSGLIFVLVWNASILAYVLNDFNYKDAFLSSLFYLSHGLFEIGGFVLVGIAGALLAYRIDRWKKFDHKLNGEFYKDLVILIIGGILLVLIGALIEIM